MKNNSFKNTFCYPIIVLTVICIVISTILAYVQGVTDPIIIKQKEEAAKAARIEVLPKAEDFIKIDMELPEGAIDAYKSTNGVGYVITTKAVGYDSSGLVVMCGINEDGTISKVKNLENNETPGLGSKVKEDKYTSQYAGKDKSLDGVEAIGGATRSSKAFEKAVNIAFDIFKTVKEGK